jgi:hypothetical protein
MAAGEARHICRLTYLNGEPGRTSKTNQIEM